MQNLYRDRRSDHKFVIQSVYEVELNLKEHLDTSHFVIKCVIHKISLSGLLF